MVCTELSSAGYSEIIWKIITFHRKTTLHTCCHCYSGVQWTPIRPKCRMFYYINTIKTVLCVKCSMCSRFSRRTCTASSHYYEWQWLCMLNVCAVHVYFQRERHSHQNKRIHSKENLFQFYHTSVCVYVKQKNCISALYSFQVRKEMHSLMHRTSLVGKTRQTRNATKKHSTRQIS